MTWRTGICPGSHGEWTGSSSSSSNCSRAGDPGEMRCQLTILICDSFVRLRLFHSAKHEVATLQRRHAQPAVELPASVVLLHTSQWGHMTWHCRPLLFYYTVSQKTRQNYFLSELRQISTDFNNFWQVDVKMSEILRGAFIFHLTWSVLPHYPVKRRSPKFALNNI